MLLDMNAFSSLEKVHSVSESGGIDGGIMALSRLAVELGRQRFAGRESPAVFSNPAPYSVYYCENGGSLTWTGIDANSNGRIDAGDTVNLYVAACPLPVNSPPTTGKFDFVVNTATYNGDEPVAMAISATFSDLTTAGSTLNGRADLSFTETSSTLVYRAMNVKRRNVAGVYSFSIVVNEAGSGPTMNVAGNIELSGVAYTLSTPSTIIGLPNTSGVLRISEASGAFVDVNLGPTSFELDFRPKAGSISFGSTFYTWQELAAGNL
ncbi:MAG: hypothetical protein V4609_11935 [Pseudomonadota bacterium]